MLKFIFPKLKGLKEIFTQIKFNLTRINNSEPLSKFALVLIILLDIFIFFSILGGIDSHTEQLTSPNEYIPNICQDIIIKENLTSESRLRKISNLILYNYNEYDYSSDSINKFNNNINNNTSLPTKKYNNLHPNCKNIIILIDTIKQDTALFNLITELINLDAEYSNINAQIEKARPSYDTSILEYRSGINNRLSDFREFQNNISQQKILSQKISVLESKINSDSTMQKLWKEIETQNKNKNILQNDLQNAYFWYPAKTLAMELLFLLPLFVVFYSWYLFNIKKSRGLQTLISSHLLIVTFIPTLIKIFEAVYDIIPKKILAKIWFFLNTYKIIAIWYYFIILITIIIAIFIIYLIQKKIFTQKKLIEKRIMNVCCVTCNKKLPAYNINACPFCGNIQFEKCMYCNELTYKDSDFCIKCGKHK